MKSDNPHNLKKFIAGMPCPETNLDDIRQELLLLRKNMLEQEKLYLSLESIHPKHLDSARNLLQYLALRQYDIRKLQYELTNWGLSSLGRMERKVQATIDTILHMISEIMKIDWNPEEKPPFCFEEGRKKLDANATAIFGELPNGRRARIMVTMPSEAATDYKLLCDLLNHGMNVARINCAHDDPQVWSKIIQNIKHAEISTGLNCVIHMDLGGPKLRTSSIVAAPDLLKVRPTRNEYGTVIAPAILYFYSIDSYGEIVPKEDNVIWVERALLEHSKGSETITFTDARSSKRSVNILGKTENSVWGSIEKTAYITLGTELKIKKGKKKIISKVKALPPRENFLTLHADDRLLLYRKDIPGIPAVIDEFGVVKSWPSIGCILPEALTDAIVGEPIWFDDGKIGGYIEEMYPDHLIIKITHAKQGGEKLKKEKGINLPDTIINLSAITDQDIEDLQFVVDHAHTVGLSFANGPEDVKKLIREMQKTGKELPGVILKIETARGFHQLPDMLLAAMELPKSGVMIARGDLAIECGFGRLAELQEEILWVCEAAHMPVIWATQVLESLAKTGVQTRSEVTDAAMGQRAECIMLNKGEHIVKATTALDDILRRMQDHQTKKRSTHRKLKLAEDFYNRWKAQ